MKFKELKNHTEQALRKMLLDLRNEAHELSVKLKLNQEKQNHKLKFIRKDIARIMAYLHQQVVNSK